MKISFRSHLFSMEDKTMCADFENAICVRCRLVLGKISLASNKNLNPNTVPWHHALVMGWQC